MNDLDTYLNSIKTYSTEQLEDILIHIDREKYNDRYELVLKELRQRTIEEKSSAADKEDTVNKVEVLNTNKKTSRGIKIFAWIWLFSAVIGIIITFLMIGAILSSNEEKTKLLDTTYIKELDITTIPKLNDHYKHGIFTLLPWSILLLITAIGLVKVKEWARIGIVILTAYSILSDIFLGLIYGVSGKDKILGKIIGLLLKISSIYFFTRVKTKNEFKHSTIQEAVSVKTNLKRNSVLFWKIYFWLLFPMIVPVFLAAGSPRIWELFDFAVFVVSYIGLYAFIWQKKILTHLFWKIIFFANIIWCILYDYLLPLPDYTKEMLHKSGYEDLPRFFTIAIELSLLFPLFYALYLYAFRRPHPNEVKLT